MVVGAVWPWARSIRPDRAQTNQLSRRAAALHLILAPLAIAVLAISNPAWFTGAYPPATALAASLLAGMLGFAVTLCGLSVTTGEWGSFNGT